MKTLIAGVVIDTYKLDTFKRHLDQAGRKYTQHPGASPGTVTLKVEFTDAYLDQDRLAKTCRKANDEAQRMRG